MRCRTRWLEVTAMGLVLGFSAAQAGTVDPATLADVDSQTVPRSTRMTERFALLAHAGSFLPVREREFRSMKEEIDELVWIHRAATAPMGTEPTTSR